MKRLVVSALVALAVSAVSAATALSPVRMLAE